ncbi:MAG: hypothetical protein H6830_00020 [Planctomycetes bacterium]|nr:hypothetical protein [Planctomycetota bacterium]MCB9910719.1 hypothetical protein [Planctomycetota bacterium]MCB9912745.1 hypothetical protein [Planctomycetota bacterium]HRV80707.1 lipopolysaccharide kinase InaA family protein [Planctomycetota bacterium]
MRDLAHKTILKVRPKRSLYEDLDEELGLVVVKRFHAPGSWQALRDPLRARREARALNHWATLGLPVPHPARVRNQAGYWEVYMPRIEGAVRLDEWLRTSSTGAQARFAQRVGSLLARLDLSGAIQGDLHAGNCLRDDDGGLWLVDPTPQPILSRRSRPGPDRWLRLCAQLREISTPGFRRRVLVAYRQQGGPAPIPETQEAWIQWEHRARAGRLVEALRRGHRWLRTSGVTTRSETRLEARSVPGGAARVRRGLTREQTQALWLRYGLCSEMGIPALLPESMQVDSTPTLVSRIPTGAHPCASLPEPGALGTLMGKLHDRGMGMGSHPIERLWTMADGTLLLDPEAWDGPHRTPIAWMDPNLGPGAAQLRAKPQDWKRFVQAFCHAQRASRPIQRELAAHLLRG